MDLCVWNSSGRFGSSGSCGTTGNEFLELIKLIRIESSQRQKNGAIYRQFYPSEVDKKSNSDGIH